MLTAIAGILVLLTFFYGYRSLQRPGFAFGLVLSTYALEQVLQQQGNSFLLARGSLINFLFAGIAGLAGLLSISRGQLRLNRAPQGALFAYGLFLMAFLSLGWSINFKISQTKLIAFLPYAVMFTFLTPLCVTRGKDIRDAIESLTIIGFFVALGMALSAYGHRGMIIATLGGKEIEANPLAAGNFGGYLLIGGVFALYSGKRRGKKFIFHLLVAVLGLYTVYRSGSRGQTIAVIMAIMFWLPVVAKVAAKKSTILALVLATMFMVGSAYLVSKGDGLDRWSSESLQTRSLGSLEAGTTMVKAAASEGILYFLFGLGTNSSFAVVGFYPHMVLLEVLGEEGVVGFLLLILFIFHVFLNGYHLMKQDFAETETRVNLGFLLSLFTFELILSCKQGSMLLSPGAGMFCIGLSVLWVAASERRLVGARKSHHSFLMQQPVFHN